MNVSSLMWQFTRYSRTAYRILEILETQGSKSVKKLKSDLGRPSLAFMLAMWHLYLSGFIQVGRFQVEGEPKMFTITRDGANFYAGAEEETDVLTRRTVYRISTVRSR